MHRDGCIDGDAARVARDAPDGHAERVKLAHQSTANVTGGPGDERADHQNDEHTLGRHAREIRLRTTGVATLSVGVLSSGIS
jgi:hypothetical protein